MIKDKNRIKYKTILWMIQHTSPFSNVGVPQRVQQHRGNEMDYFELKKTLTWIIFIKTSISPVFKRANILLVRL